MRLRQLFEEIARTGKGKSAVVGWGRGMGHKGHMMLASSVITQANETGADPYFVVSKTIGKDDPITPEEKLHLYKKVFPKHGHIFHTATDEMPDLNKVLTQLAQHGYTDATVIVGADQKVAFQYLVRPAKDGVEPYKTFGLNSLHVISRQETNDPSAGEEGPRATPMRTALSDPNMADEEKFKTWRDAMSPEVSDDEVRDLMAKAAHRMADPTWGKKPKAPKKAVAVAGEGMLDLLSKSKKTVKKKIATADEMRKYFEKEKAKEPPVHKEPGDDKNIQTVHVRPAYENSIKYANKIIREMKANEFIKEGTTNAQGNKAKGHTQPLDKEYKASMKNMMTMPDQNQSTGSAYLGWRMGVALAGAPTYPTKMAADTWLGGDPLLSTYTEEEMEMVKAASLQIGGGKIENWSGKRSQELPTTNKTSAVAKVKKNKYGI